MASLQQYLVFSFHLLGFFAAFNVVDHLLLKLYSSGCRDVTHTGSSFSLFPRDIFSPHLSSESTDFSQLNSLNFT